MAHRLASDLIRSSAQLPAGLHLGFTGSIAAAVDEDRSGRHPAYGGVVGLDVPLGAAAGVTFELSVRRDRDPSGTATEALGGISAAWSPNDALQLDAGANLGLARRSPDVQLYFGVARRF